jgi:hypothetical protein
MSSSSHLARQAQGTANERSANKNHILKGNCPSDSQETVSPGVSSPEFNDSDFFENEEYNTPRIDFHDFILFNNFDLTRDTYNLFADTDASTIAHQGSVYNGSNNEATVQIERVTSIAAAQQSPPLYDAVREAISINEAVFPALSNNCDDRSQSISTKCPPTPYLRPLELWENTFERHESIAYRFEQPPHFVRSQQRSRQQ